MSERRQKPTRRRPLDDGEQVLPNNLDAERAVLGAILIANPAYDKAVKHVSSATFYRDAHRRIWESLVRLLDRSGGAADTALLCEDLAKHDDLAAVGGPVYVAGLIDGVPRSTNVEHYARIVKDKKLLRDCIAVGQALVTDAYIAEDSAASILATADAAIIGLRHGTDSELKPLSATTSGVMDRLEYRQQHRGEVTGVPTGFKSIDEETYGWQPGDLIVLGARPSIGKSAFVMCSAFHAATVCAKKVGVFSMEMTREQLEDRIVASQVGIDLSRFRGGYVREEEWGRITLALGTMHESGLYIDDTPSQTVDRIRGECRRLQAESGLDLVVVDYIQLMPGTLDRKGATRTEELTDISRRLKKLAGELRVPIIVLSQLKRTNERHDPTPRIDDLRDCGAIEQDADIVAFLHRRDHRTSGTTKFIIAKARNGPTASCNLTLTRETCSFVDGGEEPPAPSSEEQAQERKARSGNAMRRRAHAN